MSRLLVHVEGQTEEDFVNEVLRNHLVETGFHTVGARLIGNPRPRSRRGGIKGWNVVRDDLARHLKQDPAVIVTTMVDFYGLPLSGTKSWPSGTATSALSTAQRVKNIEQEMLRDLQQVAGTVAQRFVPFIMVHEFEAVLFSDCRAFASGIGKPHLGSAFEDIRKQFSNPEEINDSPETAPSKRILGLVADYTKPLMGTLGATAIGLFAIRRECPHFNEWLTTLESMA